MNIRRVSLIDQPLLANLLVKENYIHQHLDWRTPYEWLGSQPFWVAENKGQFLAGLACIQEILPAAWIRLFAVAPSIKPDAAWELLFEKVLADFAVYADIQIVSLAVQDWFEEILKANYFNICQNIIILEWNGGLPDAAQTQKGIILRRMTDSDIGSVLTVDHLCFDDIWKISKKSLKLAYNQSTYSIVAELENKIVGYQISSSVLNYAHLSRLAVLPDVQRQGIAYLIVRNLLEYYLMTGISRVTVNTQDDNRASLALYSRLGFKHSGDLYPVFSFNPGNR